jgi:DNA-binding MarR family transcriptional regulator
MNKPSSQPSETDLSAPPGFADFDFGFLADFIGFHLRLAYDESYRSFAEALGEDSLRRGSFGLLCLISKNPGITQIELCRAAGLDKSSVTILLRGLEDAGLILRRRVEEDRRSYASELTDKGREHHGRMLAKANVYVTRIEEIIGPERQAALLETLQQLVVGIRERRQNGDFARPADE